MVRVVVVAATLRLFSSPSSSSPPGVSEARLMMEDGRRVARSSSLMYRMTLARSGCVRPGGNATAGEAVCPGGDGDAERHRDRDRDRDRERSRSRRLVDGDNGGGGGGVRDLRELVALSSSRGDSESVLALRSGR
uniref:Putative secreted protein n=1 Tax=Anopheles darlingi TaxID=43151 RepID=A0A2M4DMQ9_ANODA